MCRKDLPLAEGFYFNKWGKPAYSWCKKCHVALNFKFRRTPKGKLTEMKKDAKKRGIAFTLTLKDVEAIWDDPCAYCGRSVKILSLDRKDNRKPYEVGNVVVSCRWCNYTKGTGSLSFFYDRCRSVVENMPLDLRKLGDPSDGGERYTETYQQNRKSKTLI